MKSRIVLITIFVIVLALCLFFTYIFSRSEVDITAEISKLNPDQTTIQIINYADCKSLEKSENFWILKNCKGDYYFKFFLQNDSYYLGYCTSWSTPREAVLKLREFVGDCVDLNANDEDITSIQINKVGMKKYFICGRIFIFKDECIVGM